MNDEEAIRSQLQKVVEKVRGGGDGEDGDSEANGSSEQSSDTGQQGGGAPEQQEAESGSTEEGSRLKRSLTAAKRDLEERIEQNDDPSPERARRRRQALRDIRKRLQRTRSDDDDSETQEQDSRIREVAGNALARTEEDIIQAATAPVAAVEAQQQRGAGLPENPNDPFETPSPAERDLPPRDDLVEQVAESSDELNEGDIAGFNETEDGEFKPLLTADAQEELVVGSIAEQDSRIGEEDIIGVQETDSGEFQAVLDPEAEEGLAREQIAAEDPRIEEEDILGVERTGDGEFKPELSDEARLEIARDEFEIERDPQRLFAGTERVPLFLNEEDFEVGLGEEGEIQAELNEQGRQELREREARETAPFVSESGEQGRVEEFLTDAQLTQFDRAQRDEEPPNGIARANVPFTDQEVIDVLDSGAESFQANIVSPAADLAGQSAEMTATEPSSVEIAEGVEVQSGVDSEQNRALAEGAVQGAGAVANLPGIAADTLRLGETFREVQGDPEAAREVGEVAALTGAQFAEFSAEEPARAAGTIGGGIATGVGSGRAIERAATRGRNVRLRRQAETVVDFEDLTSGRGIEGDLPEFETSPSAPTADAVDEVRRRAADQPDDLQRLAADDGDRAVGETGAASDAPDDSLLLRSEDDPLDNEFTAQRGEFELPGLFASPDLSPLRLGVRGGESGFSFGLPRSRGRDEQVTAFPGDRIEGMPPRAAESGFESGLDGRGPDPETGGARFLEGEAEEGTAFVRATGDRTTELEAVFPPGSEFAQRSQFAVRMQDGRLVPGSLFERQRAPGDSDIDIAGGGGGDVFPAEELPSTRISRGDDTTPVSPFASGAGSGTTGGDGSPLVDESDVRAGATSLTGGLGGVTEPVDLPPLDTNVVASGASSGPSDASSESALGLISSNSSGSAPSSSTSAGFSTSTATTSFGTLGVDVPIPDPDPDPDPDLDPELNREIGSKRPPEQEFGEIAFDEVFSSGILTGAEAAEEIFGDAGFGEFEEEMFDFDMEPGR
jgi:hypothetical protein